ncbi:KR domain-containing protein, partial [Streptomyces sp. NPDC014656]|uniref:KR domain-containing protein n=1 Tax=Streptomyces sp. NPDC014656 TaxID=3364878 RepID=UPI0036FF6931
ENCRRPVLFEPAVRRLVEDGHRVFVETSAHPVLTLAVDQTAEEIQTPLVTLGTLRRKEGGTERFTTSLAEAWTQGVPVDWTRSFADRPARLVDLPTYPFQHARYWVTAAESPAAPADVTADSPFWRAVRDQDLEALATTLGTDARAALEQVLPALGRWYRARAGRPAADTWRYEVAWRPVAPPAAGALSGTWVVAVPSGAEPDAGSAAAMLSAHGAHAVTLSVPPALDAFPGQELLDARPAGVISLLPAAGTVALLQALARAEVAAPVWSVTRGAVSTGPADLLENPGDAPVWGLGQVVPLELSAQWGGLIDLPAELDARSRSWWAGVLAGGLRDEDQLAIRPSGLLARRLAPASPASPPAAGAGWTASGTVLVTGGTEPVGAHVARALADWGARHLLLTSARETPARVREELEADLAARGARCTVVVCDPADREALAGVLDSVPDGEPLTAVVHTERHREEYALDGVAPERFATLVRTRQEGSRNLHELTLGRGLSAFVLFSSIASAFGAGPGLGAYAAAHAYDDALAAHRAGLGEPAAAIAWGLWEDEVVSTPADAEKLGRLRRRGTPALPSEHAVAALRAALTGGETLSVVADLDWARYVETTGDVRPLLGEVPDAARARRERSSGGPGTGGATAIADLAAAPPEERRVLVEALIREQTAAVLHRDPAGTDAGRAFLELGMDSLTAVELRNRLAAASGVRIPARAILELRTPDKVADHLLAALASPAEATGPAEAASPAGTAAPAGPGTPESTVADTVHDLLRQAREGTDITGVLDELTALHGAFVEPSAPHAPPATGSTLLAQGADETALICFPTLLATSGCHQYARFAAPFSGVRDVAGITLPGFRAGEAVPDCLDDLVGAAADAVVERAAGAPFALVGYSSGGILAHAVTRELEERGHVLPRALVLLDTYVPDEGLSPRLVPAFLDGMTERMADFPGEAPAAGPGPSDAHRVTAMGAYLRMVADWSPADIETPILLVRADRPVPGLPGGDWRASWPQPHWTVDVPADHFGLIERGAADAARSVATWLRGALHQA